MKSNSPIRFWAGKVRAPAHLIGPRCLAATAAWAMVAGLGCCAALASEARPSQERPVDAPVRINSMPPGALVLLCPGEPFREEAAVPLGKTPLLRLMPLAQAGSSVRLTKAGFQLWTGKVSPAAPEIKAELAALTEAQKAELAWFVSPPCRRLTVVPMRVGIKKAGAKGEGLEASSDAAGFTSRFLTAFEAAVKRRFGAQAAWAAPAELAGEEFWQQLARQLNGLNVSMIGFTPAPRRLEFPAAAQASLAALDGAVLLVRAEARYLGAGRLISRAAVPLLLTAGSAAGGYAAAKSAGASFYTYSVFGPPASSDAILVQMFLVHTGTRELMWFGQLLMPQYYKQPQVTENTAARAAEQVPSAFLEKP
ncbi:MAG: hypothetical protein ACLQM8_03820 [Limisphaerales bacterium]